MGTGIWIVFFLLFAVSRTPEREWFDFLSIVLILDKFEPTIYLIVFHTLGRWNFHICRVVWSSSLDIQLYLQNNWPVGFLLIEVFSWTGFHFHFQWLTWTTRNILNCFGKVLFQLDWKSVCRGREFSPDRPTLEKLDTLVFFLTHCALLNTQQFLVGVGLGHYTNWLNVCFC